jgi:hypothetical protein
VAMLVVALLVLVIRHPGDLRGSIAMPRTLASYDAVLLRLSAGVGVLIGPAIVIGLPAWVVSCWSSTAPTCSP